MLCRKKTCYNTNPYLPSNMFLMCTLKGFRSFFMLVSLLHSHKFSASNPCHRLMAVHLSISTSFTPQLSDGDRQTRHPPNSLPSSGVDSQSLERSPRWWRPLYPLHINHSWFAFNVSPGNSRYGISSHSSGCAHSRVSSIFVSSEHRQESRGK